MPSLKTETCQNYSKVNGCDTALGEVCPQVAVSVSWAGEPYRSGCVPLVYKCLVTGKDLTPGLNFSTNRIDWLIEDRRERSLIE